MTKFSIIIPAYNVEDYLPTCLDSVLSQDFRDYEIILVDDGSNDSTGQICDAYQSSHQKSRTNPDEKHDKNTPTPPSSTILAQNSKNVKVIHQQNAGLSEARNSGVKIATGDYLIFLDGDDFLAPDALTKISTALANFHKTTKTPVDLLRFQCQNLLSNGELIPRPEPGFAPLPGPAAFPLLAHCHYTENAWLYCYRTEFFKSNHFTYAKGRLAEDFGLTPLIIARATSVAAIPDICYNYRQRPGSIMQDSAKLRQRVVDSFAGLEYQLPLLEQIGPKLTAPTAHYLSVSFLTLAIQLPEQDFLQFYQKFTRSGFKQYIRPQSLRSFPRAFLLRHFPRLYRFLFRPKD